MDPMPVLVKGISLKTHCIYWGVIHLGSRGFRSHVLDSSMLHLVYNATQHHSLLPSSFR